jgi:hypothetical protein
MNLDYIRIVETTTGLKIHKDPAKFPDEHQAGIHGKVISIK